MAKTLEQSANVAMIIMCVLVGASVVRSFVAPPHPPEAIEPLAIGAALPGSDEFGLGTAATVVAAFSRGCEFCQRSLPFYRRILQLAEMDGLRNRMIILAVEDVEGTSAILKRNGVTPHGLFSIPRSERLPIRGTPTVFVLDSAGKVRKSWVGLMDPTMEQELVSFVTSSH